ncbi:chemotaxis protein CheW [Telmatocola sphagniphila]|uniref:Chemotaxis protein CheW n=1 Tax=Telmatocola sphagniphila TaxID=1123043 RepID=A0A8E6B2Y1_9BACT|nr:chemotaxis protein CheW [Telmatocola sphagniphila]QVL30882.1 chemotaxis protein CheW [Telmatocola sphagniphila]
MTPPEEEENISFELVLPGADEPSSIGWLAPPSPPDGNESPLPGWLNNETSGEEFRSGLVPSSPTIIRKVRQSTLIVRRDEIERDALTAKAPNVPNASTLPPEALKKAVKNPLVYGLIAKVSLPRPAFQFKIEHDLPANVALLDVKPKAAVVGNRIIWSFGRVDPGQEIRLQLVIQPEEGAVINPSDLAVFEAGYKQSLHFQTPIARPRLSAVADGPIEMPMGTWETVRLQIRNSGNWPVKNAIVRGLLPTGLKLGENAPTQEEIGLLLPGEVYEFSYRVRATQEGPQTILFELSGSDNTSCQVERTIVVLAPKLELRIPGPIRAAQDQEVEFQLELSNFGRACTEQYEVYLDYSAHLEPLKFERGSIDSVRRRLSWTGPAMQPNSEVSYPVRFKTAQLGIAELNVEVRTASGARIKSSRSLTIEKQTDRKREIQEQFIASMEARLNVGFPAVSGAADATVETSQHIVFSIHNSDFALPMSVVREVGRAPHTTPVPNVPDWLVGLANIRGEIVSVVDLAGFLQINSSGDTAEKRILVVRSQQSSVQTALIVDRIRGLRNLNEQTLQPMEIASPFVRGRVESQGLEISLLQTEEMLNSPQMRQFEIY